MRYQLVVESKGKPHVCLMENTYLWEVKLALNKVAKALGADCYNTLDNGARLVAIKVDHIGWCYAD